MPLTFNPEKTYSFGKRKLNCTNNHNVEYTNNPMNYSYSGQQLLDRFNVSDFEEFLEKNPCKYSARDKITVSQIENGDRKYIGEGMPMPFNPKPEGLADNGSSFVPSAYNYSDNKANIEHNKTIKEQLSIKEKRIYNLEKTETELRDHILDSDRQIIKLQSEKEAILKELELRNKEFEDFKARFQSVIDKQQDGEALADALSSGLAHPAVAGILSLGGQILGAFAEKKMRDWNVGQPAPQPQTQQIPQAPPQYSTNQNEVF